MYTSSVIVQHCGTIECHQRQQTVDQTLLVEHMLAYWVAEVRNVVMETQVMQLVK